MVYQVRIFETDCLVFCPFLGRNRVVFCLFLYCFPIFDKLAVPLIIPRDILRSLATWTHNQDRKVLLLRGPRQVGKTHAARQHAQAHYEHLLEVNFLSDKSLHSIFEGDIDVERIFEALSAIKGVPIIARKTLVFLDEIQDCPAAISALRFFHERRPDVHVLASGSLLEFALEDTPSFGVGRVESLFLHPVSFDEYLLAAGENALLTALSKSGPGKPLMDPLHQKLSALFKSFLFTGGLPESVCLFLEKRDYHAVNRLIDHLRMGFEDDFAKYRKRVPTLRLREVFRSVSLQAGMKFVHTHAYPDAKAGQVHAALELLHKAGIVHKVYHTSANGLPLGAEINIKKYKTIPFDHGLYQRAIGLSPAELVQRDFDPINKGALAEAFVGCALMARDVPAHRGDLFYWHREAKSSNAEVDYVLQVGELIVPIEVKSAAKGRMRSMHRFLEEKSQAGVPCPIGVRLSMENMGRVDNILVMPLYAISQLDRVIREH